MPGFQFYFELIGAVAFAISGAFFYLLMAAVTWLLYGERLTLWQWAGIALISTGVLMVSMLGQPA